MANEASSGRPALGIIVRRRAAADRHYPACKRRVHISRNRPRRKVKLSAGYYGCTSSDPGTQGLRNAVRTPSAPRFLSAAAAEERDRRNWRQTGTREGAESATEDQRELHIVLTRRSVGEAAREEGRQRESRGLATLHGRSCRGDNNYFGSPSSETLPAAPSLETLHGTHGSKPKHERRGSVRQKEYYM